MRADHSRHHFFAWIATASAVASRLHAYVSPAATMASPPESKGASALLVSPGTRSTSETGTPSVVDGTRTAVDSNPTSGAPRTLAPSPTTPRGLLSVTSGPPASGSANPGQHLVPVTTPAAAANARSSTPARRSIGVDTGVTRPSAAGTRQASPPAPPSRRRRPTTVPLDRSTADSAGGTPVQTRGPARQAPSLQTHATPWTTTPSNATPPAATRAAATAPSVTRPPTTPLVATSLSATNLARRTRRDRTRRDRTCRDAAAQR